MGNPLHYSLELPQRCLQLIEELWPRVEQTRQPEHADLGPLTTTFLISMSMPIINLPVERLERAAQDQSYANDRNIAPAIATAVTGVLGSRKFNRAPFYLADAWHFTSWSPSFNIAEHIPDEVVAELGSKEAAERASNMQTAQWCSILRNAMAHGGIAYLDEDGRPSYGKPVQMYAFASGKYDRKRQLTGLNLLRISERNYLAFIRKWVGWLRASGLN